ncbi:hypothetical protein QBC39DRAFT_155944 [Podospora conica]|nr:hypothetical protein QBC39DRAFT_155944 [Schizothecium conicum]
MGGSDSSLPSSITLIPFEGRWRWEVRSFHEVLSCRLTSCPLLGAANLMGSRHCQCCPMCPRCSTKRCTEPSAETPSSMDPNGLETGGKVRGLIRSSAAERAGISWWDALTAYAGCPCPLPRLNTPSPPGLGRNIKKVEVAVSTSSHLPRFYTRLKIPSSFSLPPQEPLWSVSIAALEQRSHQPPKRSPTYLTRKNAPPPCHCLSCPCTQQQQQHPQPSPSPLGTSPLQSLPLFPLARSLCASLLAPRSPR